MQIFMHIVNSQKYNIIQYIQVHMYTYNKTKNNTEKIYKNFRIVINTETMNEWLGFSSLKF